MMNDRVNKINDDALEGISGGVLFYSKGISGADPEKPWEVLDDHTGNNIYWNGEKQVFRTRTEAEDAAKKIGANLVELSWEQVQVMRGIK